MKIAPLVVVSASALETSTSTSASALLAAVGKRNVTHMEALVQGLAEESIKEPAWKFDKDIRDALNAINEMFVKSIQTALMDQHKVDQEAHNCQVDKCFHDCQSSYDSAHTACRAHIAVCEDTEKAHGECRDGVYNMYKDMAKKCGELHCFEPTPPKCKEESCICDDVRECHYADKGKCEASAEAECKSDPHDGYGAWLQKMISTYTMEFQTWTELHGACSKAYQDFLIADLECDGIQRNFEACMCEQEVWEEAICSQDFAQCNAECKAIYDESTPNLMCQELDRKIDWSATKKIECYLDVLLHDYTKDELLKKCGTEDCVNVAREEAYKHCATICPNVDSKGDWGVPECHPATFEVGEDGVKKTKKGHVVLKNQQHHFRKHVNEYHLGDTEYACDMNGPPVHTNKRMADRKAEGRCTEHLDIDYQVINIADCKPKKNTVCDADFHCKYYAKYDDTSRIGCINDCCSDGSGKGCDEEQFFLSCVGGVGSYEAGVSVSEVKKTGFEEHSHAWAYNRCPCSECNANPVVYPGDPADHCYGVHSQNFAGKVGGTYR